MRIARYERTGPAREVLTIANVPRPAPRAGEVLIRMRASGVNPADVRRRAGWSGPGFASVDRSVVPHSDGAGVVEEIGEGVERRWLDRRVWVWNAGGASFYGFPDEGCDVGTAAEYVALPARFVADLPEGVSFEVGACLGAPAVTAHFVVRADGTVVERTVLVQGGTGAVGELAVQIASADGATVIATVGSADRVERARQAGAHHVIDRSREDVAAAVLTLAPKGIDRIVEVEFGLNVAADAQMIAPNGTIASYSSPSVREPVLPYYALQRKGVTVRYVQAYILAPEHRRRAIAGVNELLAVGTLRPTIAATFPLDDIAAAHETVERHEAIGNVVITL
jgi:NADPH2:quinone reductase